MGDPLKILVTYKFYLQQNGKTNKGESLDWWTAKDLFKIVSQSNSFLSTLGADRLAGKSFYKE